MDADELFYPAPSGARGGMGIINSITENKEVIVEQDSTGSESGSPIATNITCTFFL